MRKECKASDNIAMPNKDASGLSIMFFCNFEGLEKKREHQTATLDAPIESSSKEMEDTAVLLEALIIYPEDEMRFFARMEVTAEFVIHCIPLNKSPIRFNHVLRIYTKRCSRILIPG